MKLRIRGNSIRLRLTKGEVAQFKETGSVEEVTEFGLEQNQRFVYALSVLQDINASRAVLENNRISIFLPEDQSEQWTTTNQVGIRVEQSLGAEKTLQILIEKDFACLEERPGEDESDAFAHPKAGQAC